MNTRAICMRVCNIDKHAAVCVDPPSGLVEPRLLPAGCLSLCGIEGKLLSDPLQAARSADRSDKTHDY